MEIVLCVNLTDMLFYQKGACRKGPGAVNGSVSRKLGNIMIVSATSDYFGIHLLGPVAHKRPSRSTEEKGVVPVSRLETVATSERSKDKLTER
jgi:hypothetical protein